MGLGLGELLILLLLVLLASISIRRIAKHRNTSVTRVLVAVGGGLTIGAILLYVFVLGPQSRADVAAASLGTPIGRVVPWIDRAQAATEQVLRDSSGTIASTIQGVTHPTGSSPVVDRIEVRRAGDRISARIAVDWKGGFMGSDNRTTVVWEFAEAGHIRTALLEDTGAFGVGESNKAQLDEYFRSEVYPVIRNRIDN